MQKVLLSAFLAAVVSSGMTYWLLNSTEPQSLPVVEAASDSQVDGELVRVLHRLADALEKERDVLTAPPRESSRSDATQVNSQLEERLTELIEQLVAATAAANASTSTTAPVLRDRKTNLDAVERVIVQVHGTDEGAKKELGLMTMSELLIRFGAPTNIWSSQNGNTILVWHEELMGSLQVELHDGYVVQAYTNRP